MPLNDILRGLRAFWKAWTWFWFRPVSARGIGVMRILMAAMILMTSIDILPILDILVGPEGVVDAKAAGRGPSWGRWTWFDHVDSMGAVYAIHGATLLVNFLFLVGFR